MLFQGGLGQDRWPARFPPTATLRGLWWRDRHLSHRPCVTVLASVTPWPGTTGPSAIHAKMPVSITGILGPPCCPPDVASPGGPCLLAWRAAALLGIPCQLRGAAHSHFAARVPSYSRGMPPAYDQAIPPHASLQLRLLVWAIQPMAGQRRLESPQFLACSRGRGHRRLVASNRVCGFRWIPEPRAQVLQTQPVSWSLSSTWLCPSPLHSPHPSLGASGRAPSSQVSPFWGTPSVRRDLLCPVWPSVLSDAPLLISTSVTGSTFPGVSSWPRGDRGARL